MVNDLYSAEEQTESFRLFLSADVSRKHICNFLLVINSNFGHISYRFLDIDV